MSEKQKSKPNRAIRAFIAGIALSSTAIFGVQAGVKQFHDTQEHNKMVDIFSTKDLVHHQDLIPDTYPYVELPVTNLDRNPKEFAIHNNVNDRVSVTIQTSGQEGGAGYLKAGDRILVPLSQLNEPAQSVKH